MDIDFGARYQYAIGVDFFELVEVDVVDADRDSRVMKVIIIISIIIIMIVCVDSSGSEVKVRLHGTSTRAPACT